MSGLTRVVGSVSRRVSITDSSSCRSSSTAIRCRTWSQNTARRSTWPHNRAALDQSWVTSSSRCRSPDRPVFSTSRSRAALCARTAASWSWCSVFGQGQERALPEAPALVPPTPSPSPSPSSSSSQSQNSSSTSRRRGSPRMRSKAARMSSSRTGSECPRSTSAPSSRAGVMRCCRCRTVRRSADVGRPVIRNEFRRYICGPAASSRPAVVSSITARSESTTSRVGVPSGKYGDPGCRAPWQPHGIHMGNAPFAGPR